MKIHAANHIGGSQRRLEGVVNSAMDAIITINERQLIELFNPAAELMFMVKAADVLGTHISQFIPERKRKSHDAHVKRFGAGGTTDRRMGSLGAISGLRSNGEEFPIEASISHVEVEGEKPGTVEKLFTVILRDVTERQISEENRALLTREVDHRAKNALGIVQSFVTLTKASNIEDYREALRGRIQALARAHSLLSASQWRGASLVQVVMDELAPYAKEGQVRTGGSPPVRLSGDTVQPMSLLFHELATNAVKYGALSNDQGRISVDWIIEDNHLCLEWIERGGPRVVQPEDTGFGSRLLHQVSEKQLGAEIEFDWDSQGLGVRLRLPTTAFSIGPEAITAEPTAKADNSEPLSVLVVEDEALIAMELADDLQRLGWRVIGPASSVDEARDLITKTEAIDAAVLDVNLHGEEVFPVAALLKQRGVPFLFCTGYELVDQSGQFSTVQVLKKPVNVDMVVSTLAGLTQGRLVH